MKRLILWAPLALFLIFMITVAVGLYAPADRKITSRLIGKPVPEFALEPAVASHPTLSSADLKRGEPRLVNLFASWCVPCIAEAPQLLELKRRGIPIDAIAIRDRPQDVAAFLAKWGDPYQRIASDPNTQVQIALGSSGVPETFVVDGRGVIRYQHIGDIRPEQVPEIVRAYEAAR
ncbi:MAG: Cytochrome c-type biogenesis protein CcmG/DsbE, thiol:disulfide oxidoreductase [uncultured Sphingosinicella sp.]|uniref:Cytochrome c-type biogenesis protein CcmG/DsbE, thiol:disulfide oxidoreductase n=1 Tax=uncultured Sphingosinicella sp. TaxID=478748 RepID=A0A6J4UAC0_9SPHN|nr:DsbE family thiol:disulfide interchange protein [uncultured Sphingosinicella sp.]CAA9542370.1 MAG: Cytochrome c-type biogenesis protein CcmG/DsbE, thiol:disulfide oxidoreductase [uncultured Sphingosinicella sp.]